MKARILSGEEVLAEFDLREGEYVIGSSATARLQIASDSVAPEHARLRVGAYGVEVEDLESGLETLVGDVPLAGRQTLPGGATIRIGDFSVEVWEPEFEHPTGGRYEVGSVVAKGAMGVIRRAREASTGREVAMKRMHEELEAGDAALAVRFVQEARITAHLEHPNIVPVHDVSPGADGARFYTMKMVHGVSLEEIVALLEAGAAESLKAYPLETLLTIFQKVCDALAFAHSKGVIHRDLKPANIMVGEYGEVLVMDWGLAKLTGETAAEMVGVNAGGFAEMGGGVTLAGTIMGTPQYMAPEQASGDTESVDERSDVYALGAILYRLLTLHSPVEGRTTSEVLGRVRAGSIVPPPKRVGSALLPHLPAGRIPDSLAAVTMKAMALAPDRRYQSVPELQAEIRAYQSGFATGAERAGALRQFALLVKRHQGVATAIAASLVLLAGLSVFFTIRLIGERDHARESEEQAKRSAAEARASAEVARQATLEAEEKTRIAADALKKEKASAAQAKRDSDAKLAAEEKVRVESEAKLAALSKAATLEQGLKVAETTAMTAKSGEEKAQMEASAEKIKTAQALQTKATQRIAKLGGETDEAALRGDAATVLLASVFLLGRESNPELQQLHRRRIGLAVRRMPRLLFLRDRAQLARVSPSGARAVCFEGGMGTLFDPRGRLRHLGHGTKAMIEAAEFSGDSRWLFCAGTSAPGQPAVWLWDAENGKEVKPPQARIEGNLERFLPYPDRSRIVTIHTEPKGKTKQIRLWTFDSKPAVAMVQRTSLAGLVSALVPLGGGNQFLLQSFGAVADERGGVIHQFTVSSSTLNASYLGTSPLRTAAAISPDGQRALQLAARQLRLAEAAPPDASGRSPAPHLLTYAKSASGPGVPLSALAGEAQELIDGATGKPLGRPLRGGASAFSPNSKWLLLADGQRVHLHDAVANEPGRDLALDLPATVTTLGFTADSSRAIVASQGARLSLWSTADGHRACADLLLPAEIAEVSTSDGGRFVFATGGGASLWETTPPPSARKRVEFDKLSPAAVWVSGDGRVAISIPSGALAASGNAGGAPMADGASASFLRRHELANLEKTGSFMGRSADLRTNGTSWLTRDGRFFITWGGDGGVKVMDTQKRASREVVPVNHPTHRQEEYKHFYQGHDAVVVERPRDTTLALVIEDARRDPKSPPFLVFDGVTGDRRKDEGTLRGTFGFDAEGRLRVADLDGKKTLADAATRLGPKLPPDARRAFFSEDGKLVAILRTSATEPAETRPVLSDLLFQSDLLGKTADELGRASRHYGFAPPAGRRWWLEVYDVATRAALLGAVPLPGLAAFRWEGERCVALSNTGEWTEIDCARDGRSIEELREVALVLTGRAIDPATGEVALGTRSFAALVQSWERLRQTYPADWQTGVK